MIFWLTLSITVFSTRRVDAKEKSADRSRSLFSPDGGKLPGLDVPNIQSEEFCACLGLMQK
jgi:hypothetical protein